MMATPQFPVPPPKPAAYNTNAPNSSGAPNTEKLKEIDEDELPLSEFPHSEGFKHRPVQRRATAPTRRQDPSPQFNQPSRPHHKPSHPHPPPKPQNGLEHRRSLHPHPQQPPRYKRKIGPYTLTKTLGAGSMGKVKLGIHEVDHSKVAVKIIPRKVMESSRSASNTPVPANVASPSPGDRSRPVDSDTVPLSEASMGEDKRVLREVSILALLYHPYIVQLVDFVITTHYYYLVFEYVEGGQMLDYIISHGKLSERVARKFIRQIVSSLDYCHKNSIVHRDLKIENILISNSGDIKIIDFGLSNLYSSQSHLSTFCGSLYFAAPELLRAHAYTGPEVDLWSLGIVLYVLVCGKVPFDDQSMAVLHAKIKRGVVEYPSFLSSECRHLISRLLVTDPSERADMIEVKNHPWLSKGYPGPPDSYIPQRQPIQLPIDMKVVEKLSGFQLGSKEGVKNQIINATKELANNADSKYAPGVQLKVNKNQFRSGGRAPVKAPLSYPAASLYYLAKEKIERDAMGEAAKQLTFPVDQEVGSSSSANANSSSSNATSSSHLNPNSNVRRSTSGVARSKSCRPAVDGRYPPMQRGTFQNRSVRNSTPQSQDAPKPDANTAGRWSDVEAPRPTSLTPNPPRKVPSSSPLTTKSEHISTSSDNSDTKPSINIEPGVISAPSSTAPESKNPENLRVSALAINEKAGKPERKPSKLKKFGQLLLTRGPSMREARRKSPSAVSSPTTSDAPHSIQGIQSVYLKGLFSVQTTSTKKPAAIRQEIVRVLNQMGLSWRESDGYISVAQNSGGKVPPSTPQPNSPNLSSSAPEPKGKYFKPLPSVPTSAQESLEDSGSQSGDSDHMNSSEVIEPSDNIDPSKLSVRFEIYIVKIPLLLGIHGIKFRRLVGHPWEYKELCSRVLEQLRL